MEMKILFFALAGLILVSTCLQFSQAAAVGLSDDSEERLMRQLAAFTAQSDGAADDTVQGIAEKRYSQAQYTSARGSSLDRAAVRRLLNMLVGKRSRLAQKRSLLDGTDEPMAFDGVKGYVVIAGKITDNLLNEALGHGDMSVDGAASE